MTRRTVHREGVRIAVEVLGGQGGAVLCLHGLAGHAGEWAALAAALRGHARLVAFDARGHGASERHPSDVSRAANVADAAAVAEACGIAPAVVVGQSLGGQTALLLAAQRPELVRGLVLVEASPDPGDGRAHVAVEASLRSWPVPFASRGDAVAYFAGRGFAADVWADGLERREDGWWPRFDIGVLVRTLREADRRAHWEEWERIACPVLVVRGDKPGTLDAAHADLLVRRARDARAVTVPGAGHDVHLDQPAALARAVLGFLRALG